MFVIPLYHKTEEKTERYYRNMILVKIDQNMYFHNKNCKNFIQGETNKVSQESGDPIFGDLNAKALRTLVQ